MRMCARRVMTNESSYQWIVLVFSPLLLWTIRHAPTRRTTTISRTTRLMTRHAHRLTRARSNDTMANPRRGAEVENATKLQLGEDFQTATPLWNAEVKILLEKMEAKKAEQADSAFQSNSNAHMVQQTLEYVNRFNNYDNQDAIGDAKKLWERDDQQENAMHPFEAALINNLAIDDVDEAFTLIPTLRDKYGDNEEALQHILDQLKVYQNV